jgi:prefoldin subunit 5
MDIQTIKRYVELTRLEDDTGIDTLNKRCAILEQHRDALQAHIRLLQDYLEKLEQKVEFYRGYLVAEEAKKQNEEFVIQTDFSD